MDIQRIYDLLRIERECVSRNCDRNCLSCELVQERDELLRMYDILIALIGSYIPTYKTMEITGGVQNEIKGNN